MAPSNRHYRTPQPCTHTYTSQHTHSTHPPTGLVRPDVGGELVLVQLDESQQPPRPQKLLLHALLRHTGLLAL